MAANGARGELEDVCRRFLNGEASSITQFTLKIRPLVRRIVDRYAWDLDRDLLDDVVQEMHLLLLQRREAVFDPGRGSAVTFVALIARRAARNINAQFAPAGRQTRPPAKREVSAFDAFRWKSRVRAIDALTAEQIPTVADFAPAIDAQIDAEFILSVAPAPVAHGLRRVYYDKVSMEKAAREANLTRFALHRMINSFRDSIAA